MKVHGTSAVLLGLYVLLFTQKVGESKKVRFFYFNMICSPRGFRNSEFQILTNQKSTNQMIASEILDKYNVVKSRWKYRNLEMQQFSTKKIFIIPLEAINIKFSFSSKH